MLVYASDIWSAWQPTFPDCRFGLVLYSIVRPLVIAVNLCDSLDINHKLLPSIAMSRCTILAMVTERQSHSPPRHWTACWSVQDNRASGWQWLHN